jgi:hypothetical protein
VESTVHGWNVFDGDTPVLTHRYSFGPAMASALAVAGAEGMIVVSPPLRAKSGVYDDVAIYGTVRALVASNAFHYMGIPEWKARFPQAQIFAPAQAIRRIERQTRLSGIRALADAASLTGPRVELIDMPHYRTGEVLVRMDTTRGPAWYVTDVMLNMTTLPSHPLIKLLFRLSNSAPGLKYNNIAPLFMVKEKAALRRWLASEFHRRPPRWLIPAHGEIVDLEMQRDAVRALFASH